MTKNCENCGDKFFCQTRHEWDNDDVPCENWKRQEYQYEKVLRLLKNRSYTTMGLTAEFIPAPQKAVQILREKLQGTEYKILTEDIPNCKHKKYTLVKDGQQSLFNVVTAPFGVSQQDVS